MLDLVQRPVLEVRLQLLLAFSHPELCRFQRGQEFRQHRRDAIPVRNLIPDVRNALFWKNALAPLRCCCVVWVKKASFPCRRDSFRRRKFVEKRRVRGSESSSPPRLTRARACPLRPSRLAPSPASRDTRDARPRPASRFREVRLQLLLAFSHPELCRFQRGQEFRQHRRDAIPVRILIPDVRNALLEERLGPVEMLLLRGRLKRLSRVVAIASVQEFVEKRRVRVF